MEDRGEQLLRVAVEEGYFRVPRETSLMELSQQVGMSDAEASKQLRRQLDTVLSDYIIDEDSK